jgi:murein DD-endopeptidase MepM/ murein hydrolase activator NlpD
MNSNRHQHLYKLGKPSRLLGIYFLKRACWLVLAPTLAFAQPQHLVANPSSSGATAISSPFGMRTSPFTSEHEQHNGVDIPSQSGSPILATGDGKVTFAAYAPGYGNLVEIDHGQGYSTRYGHAQTLLVKTGDLVKQLQVIATVGSTGRATGSHLHFEASYQGKPFDPMLLLAGYYPSSDPKNKNILIFTSNKLKAPWQLTQYASGKVKPEVLYSSKNIRPSGEPFVIVRSRIQGSGN